jgi:hypothetical protein
MVSRLSRATSFGTDGYSIGDRLLVGLSTGTLRIYRVNEVIETAQDATRSNTRAVDLVREEDKFSRRAIQQLAIIKEANMLVSLSDGHVSIHDLQTFQLQEKLDKTKRNQRPCHRDPHPRLSSGCCCQASYTVMELARYGTIP